MNSRWNFVGGAFLVLFAHLYLLVPFSGDASLPVSAGFLVLYGVLVLTGLAELAVAFGRSPFAEYEREVSGLGCLVFGIGATPLAILDLLDPETPVSEATLWVSIAVVMPLVGIYYLRGGGSFGEEQPA